MPKDSYASGPSSNPSSKSYSGGGGGGVSSGKSTGKSNSSGANMGGLGVTTGKTIYGNTAFGPAGGMATGYATRTGNISGIGPSMTTFSNFRTPSGGAMFSGRAGNTPVTARNAQQAAGMLSAMQRAQGRRNGFGMLSGDPVTTGPVTTPVRSIPLTQAMIPALFGGLTRNRFNPYSALQAYRSPVGPEGWAMAGTGLKNQFETMDQWHNYMGSDRGYMTSGGIAAPRPSAPNMMNTPVPGGVLGTPGVGMSGTGNWSNAAKSYYGGYDTGRPRYSNSLTGIRN